jgi:hypothetical protein
LSQRGQNITGQSTGASQLPLFHDIQLGRAMSEATPALDGSESAANWKSALKPQLLQAAKETAADILENFAAIIKNAEVEAATHEAQQAVAATLDYVAGMARDLAMELRNQNGCASNN